MLTKTQAIVICLSPFLIFYLFVELCAMFISIECKIKKHD
jgi:hypothetical protein